MCSIANLLFPNSFACLSSVRSRCSPRHLVSACDIRHTVLSDDIKFMHSLLGFSGLFTQTQLDFKVIVRGPDGHLGHHKNTYSTPCLFPDIHSLPRFVPRPCCQSQRVWLMPWRVKHFNRCSARDRLVNANSFGIRTEGRRSEKPRSTASVRYEEPCSTASARYEVPRAT